MKARINVITLGVDDLERSLAFYRDGMGLTTDGIFGTEFEHGAVVFYNMQGGLILATYQRKDLAWDSALPVSAPGVPAFSIGHLVASREEVDGVMAQAEAAGARIVKAAEDKFWGGYGGYFQDPDGHLWEVIWNPALEIKD
jgi:catechol 2,3-dioxygenase-like lactoylglutathione lyase family enzyme